MCYDIATKVKPKKDYYNALGLSPTAEASSAAWSPLYHANGFGHPSIPVVTDSSPGLIQEFSWGLVQETKKWNMAFPLSQLLYYGRYHAPYVQLVTLGQRDGRIFRIGR